MFARAVDYDPGSAEKDAERLNRPPVIGRANDPIETAN